MAKKRTTPKNQSGFSVIEILLVIVVIGVLLAIIFTGYVAVHRNNNNQKRQQDITTIYKSLEAYYVDNSNYPTLADMNSASWLTQNMPTLSLSNLQDPTGKADQLVTNPQANAYAYEVVATDGASCNDTTVICAHYTLVATLDQGTTATFVKSSLN